MRMLSNILSTELITFFMVEELEYDNFSKTE